MIVTSIDLHGLLDGLKNNVGTMIMVTADFVISFISTMTNLFLGLIFSIYFLASKELLAETPLVYTVLLNVTYISILFTVIAQGLSVGFGYKLVERHKIKRMIKKGEHR